MVNSWRSDTVAVLSQARFPGRPLGLLGLAAFLSAKSLEHFRLIGAAIEHRDEVRRPQLEGDSQQGFAYRSGRECYVVHECGSFGVWVADEGLRGVVVGDCHQVTVRAGLRLVAKAPPASESIVRRRLTKACPADCG